MQFFVVAVFVLAVAVSAADASSKAFCRDSVFRALKITAAEYDTCMLRQIGDRVRAQCSTGFCSSLSDEVCTRRIQIRVNKVAPRFCSGTPGPIESTVVTPTPAVTPMTESTAPESATPTPTVAADPLATAGDCRRAIGPAIRKLSAGRGTCNVNATRRAAKVACGSKGLCRGVTISVCIKRVERRVGNLLNCVAEN